MTEQPIPLIQQQLFDIEVETEPESEFVPPEPTTPQVSQKALHPEDEQTLRIYEQLYKPVHTHNTAEAFE